MLRREVMKMGGGLFGLGAGTPSRFPYKGRPQPSPAVAPSPGIVTRANRVIVFGPSGTVVGVFVYAVGTTPALGNLPVAWISESTVDPFGNALPSPATDIATFNSATHELAWMSKGAVHVGLTTDFSTGSVTGVSGGLSVASPLATGADVPGSVHLDSVLSPRGNGVTPQLKLFNGTVIAANGAAVPVTGGLAVTGGATTDTLHATSTSALDGAVTVNAKETITAGGLAVTGGTTTDTLAVNGETTLTPQVIQAHPVITQNDHTVITVIATVATRLTNAWNIFANDAAGVDIGYRLKAGGFGTQATGASVGLTVALALFATFGSVALPAADIPAGQTFLWEFDGVVIVTATGAGGAGRATGKFAWGQPGVASKSYEVGQSGLVDTSVNWTGGHSMDLTAAWASAVGAPSITCLWSQLERTGP